VSGEGEVRGGGEGGEVVPFPAGSRHPSEWPGDQVEEPEGYCFSCDAPAQADPCPRCGRPLLGREPSLFEEERHGARQPPFDIEEQGLDEFTNEQYLSATTDEYRSLAEHMARAAFEPHEQQAVAPQIPGLDTGVVGFDDVTGESASLVAEETSDLAVRVGTGVVLGALFLGALWLGGGWFLALVSLVATVALGEFYATLRKRGFTPAALFGLLGGIGVMVGAWLSGPSGIGGVIVLTAVAVFLWYALGLVRHDPVVNGSLTLLGLAWVPGLIAFAVPMLKSTQFRPLILALVALTVLHDAGAYFVGRSLGRTALAPRLSPAKTVEGLLGGTLFVVAAGLGLQFVEPFDLGVGIALAAVVAVFGPLGDLAESMVKRTLEVKDMGSVLPGHGGLLDRIDALVFVVPAGYFLYRWLGLLA
jgi:CDP-diglyceride synthetase